MLVNSEPSPILGSKLAHKLTCATLANAKASRSVSQSVFVVVGPIAARGSLKLTRVSLSRSQETRTQLSPNETRVIQRVVRDQGKNWYVHVVVVYCINVDAVSVELLHHTGSLITNTQRVGLCLSLNLIILILQPEKTKWQEHKHHHPHTVLM